MVNLIPRFYDCSSGAVYVDGRNVCTYGLTELRDKIGVVPQKSVLFAGTIRSNMQWGKPDATDEEIFAALEIAQAKDVVSKKEKGLDTEVELRMAIGSMKHKPTLFIVSQRTSAIQYADKIVVLDDGSVVGIGTHEELMNTCEVYREIYDSQYKRTK